MGPHWILLLALYGSNGIALTSANFLNEAGCEAAAEAATKRLPFGWGAIVKHVCVPEAVWEHR